KPAFYACTHYIRFAHGAGSGGSLGASLRLALRPLSRIHALRGTCTSCTSGSLSAVQKCSCTFVPMCTQYASRGRLRVGHRQAFLWHRMLLFSATSLLPSLASAKDNRPDLNGIWTNASLTNLTRPRGVEKLVLSEQEAARVA